MEAKHIVGFLCFLSAVVWCKRRLRAQAALPLAPLNQSSFLWGHELVAFKGEVVMSYLKWAVDIASVYRIKAALFRSDIIILTDNLAMQHVFHDAYHYVKPAAFIPLVIKTLGKGLLWAEDDEHRHLRKLVAHAFTPGAVNAMTGDVFYCAEACARRLASDLRKKAPGDATNLTLYISPCTLEAIARVGFGQSFPFDSPESIAINDAWRDDVQMMSTFSGFLAPIVISIFPWITKLPIATLQEDSVAKKIILGIGRDLIQRETVNPDGKDIFSLLVRDWSLTKEQLLENIVTFLMAGHETTSGVLAFTLLDLARDLESQHRLRAELRDVDVSDYVVLDKLPYLDAVIREGLRLHPTPRDTERVATRDDVIALQTPIVMTDGQTASSFVVKAGDRFIIPWKVMNVNPKVWGKDAALFKPSRWLVPGGVPSSGLPRGPFSNIASFADGPRVCIGWRLALMELKIILGVLVKSFEFKDTGVQIEQRLSPSLQPFVNGQAGQLPLHIAPVESV